jgi:hypothetical protein
MGTFLVVLTSNAARPEASRLFESALSAAPILKSSKATAVRREASRFVAAFPRLNGSAGTIAVDPDTGLWLVTAGTWLHRSGFGSGEELRLLQALHKNGLDASAGDLDGFFTVAGALAADSTFLLTDIVGSCHSFVRQREGWTAISNSSLLLASLGETQLDLVAAQEFLAGGIVYENRTLFSDVRKLSAGTIYRFEGPALTEERRYWSVSGLTPDSLSGDRAVGALAEEIRAGARRIYRIYPRIVCDLTGGYDSRTLAAGLRSAGIPLSATVSGPVQSPDVRVSKALARIADISHRLFEPAAVATHDQVRKAVQLADGEYDAVEYARVLEVSSSLARDFEISLNGSFGEVGRGYWWEILFPRTGRGEPLDAGAVARLRYQPRGFDPGGFPSRERINLPEHYAGIVARCLKGLDRSPNTFQLDFTYLNLRMQRWQGRIASTTNQVWPCLSPFMFRSILEIMLQTSHRDRRRSLLVRRLLPLLDKTFAEYPL